MGEFNHTRHDYNYNLKLKGLNVPKHLYLFNSDLYFPFGAKLILNQIKIYMGAKYKSEPISIKFGKDISEVYLIYFP